MSFFVTADGTPIQNETGTAEMSTAMEVLPKGTRVLCSVDEATYKAAFENPSEQVIQLRWVVMAPKEHANRKIFQKLHVFSSDSSKAEKSKRMLFAIDKNAGGKLAALGRAPDENDIMAALANRPMVLELDVWESEDKSKSGNWVRAVAPHKQGQQQPTPAPKPAPQSAAFDDDVPF